MKEGGDDVGVVGKRELFAADDVDIALVEFTETAFLGAFAAEIEADLSDFKGKIEIVFVFNDVTS